MAQFSFRCWLKQVPLGLLAMASALACTVALVGGCAGSGAGRSSATSWFSKKSTAAASAAATATAAAADRPSTSATAAAKPDPSRKTAAAGAATAGTTTSASAASLVARASTSTTSAPAADRPQVRPGGIDDDLPAATVRRMDAATPTRTATNNTATNNPAVASGAGKRKSGPAGSLNDTPRATSRPTIDPSATRTIEKATIGLDDRHANTRTAELIDDLPAENPQAPDSDESLPSVESEPLAERDPEMLGQPVAARPADARPAGARPAAASPAADLPAGDANSVTAAAGPQEFAAAQTVAIVGRDHILAGDIDGMINLMLAPATSKMSAEDLERAKPQLEEQKKMMFRQQLQSEVQTKLGYLEFMRQVPPDKGSDLQKRINESFEKDLELVRQRLRTLEAQAKQEAAAAQADRPGTAKPKDGTADRKEEVSELARRDPILFRIAILMNQEEIETLGDLDLLLRRYKSSLEKQQRAYGEHKLMQMSVMKHVRKDVEVSHEQMLNYYREHLDSYAIPARVRWEEIMVRFDRHPTEDAALAEIAALGNEVYLGGASLAGVAKRSSHGPTAAQGGQFDWTDRGSLASQTVEEALFTLPLNKLSQIIRDERGLHIVRVLERTEATHVPFLEAQVEIKEKIRAEFRQSDVQNYLTKLRKTTNVWTIFDDQ